MEANLQINSTHVFFTNKKFRDFCQHLSAQVANSNLKKVITSLSNL